MSFNLSRPSPVRAATEVALELLGLIVLVASILGLSWGVPWMIFSAFGG